MKNKILFYSILLLLAAVNICKAQETKQNSGAGVSQKTVAYMSIIGTKAEKVRIAVIDSAEKEVYSTQTEFEVTGINNFAIDPPRQLAKGDYLVTITTDQNIFKHKIVIN